MEEEVQRLKKLNDLYDKKWHEEHEGKNLHTNSAPETRERLLALELTQTNLMEKLEENQEINDKAHIAIMDSMKDFHISTNESLKALTDKLDKALEKKAGIWVERVLYGAGGIAGTFGLYKLLEAIF